MRCRERGRENPNTRGGPRGGGGKLRLGRGVCSPLPPEREGETTLLPRAGLFSPPPSPSSFLFHSLPSPFVLLAMVFQVGSSSASPLETSNEKVKQARERLSELKELADTVDKINFIETKTSSLSYVIKAWDVVAHICEHGFGLNAVLTFDNEQPVKTRGGTRLVFPVPSVQLPCGTQLVYEAKPLGVPFDDPLALSPIWLNLFVSGPYNNPAPNSSSTTTFASLFRYMHTELYNLLAIYAPDRKEFRHADSIKLESAFGCMSDFLEKTRSILGDEIVEPELWLAKADDKRKYMPFPICEDSNSNKTFMEGIAIWKTRKNSLFTIIHLFTEEAKTRDDVELVPILLPERSARPLLESTAKMFGMLPAEIKKIQDAQSGDFDCLPLVYRLHENIDRKIGEHSCFQSEQRVFNDEGKTIKFPLHPIDEKKTAAKRRRTSASVYSRVNDGAVAECDAEAVNRDEYRISLEGQVIIEKYGLDQADRFLLSSVYNEQKQEFPPDVDSLGQKLTYAESRIEEGKSLSDISNWRATLMDLLEDVVSLIGDYTTCTEVLSKFAEYIQENKLPVALVKKKHDAEREFARVTVIGYQPKLRTLLIRVHMDFLFPSSLTPHYTMLTTCAEAAMLMHSEKGCEQTIYENNMTQMIQDLSKSNANEGDVLLPDLQVLRPEFSGGGTVWIIKNWDVFNFERKE